MKLSELWRTKTKLASCDAIGMKLVISLQALKIGTRAFHEFHVVHPGLEVAPDVIDVQLPPPLNVPHPLRREI